MNAIQENTAKRDVGLPAVQGSATAPPDVQGSATAPPEALLFDLDGVLADVSDSYRVCILQTAIHFGARQINDASIQAAKRTGNANNDWVLTRWFLAARGIDIPLEAVRTVFQDLYLGKGKTPGLRERESLLVESELLRKLADRFALGVVTGRPRAEAVWFLDRFGIQDCFRTIVTLEDAPAKPDPAPVRLAMKQLGVASAWMIGDTIDDVQAAIGAGIPCIGVVSLRAGATDDYAALRDAGASAIVTQISQLTLIIP